MPKRLTSYDSREDTTGTAWKTIADVETKIEKFGGLKIARLLFLFFFLEEFLDCANSCFLGKNVACDNR